MDRFADYNKGECAAHLKRAREREEAERRKQKTDLLRAALPGWTEHPSSISHRIVFRKGDFDAFWDDRAGCYKIALVQWTETIGISADDPADLAAVWVKEMESQIAELQRQLAMGKPILTDPNWKPEEKPDG